MGWGKQLAKSIPFSKLNKYHTANLTFDLFALYFGVKFAMKVQNEVFGAAFLLLIMLLAFACVVWASRQ